MNLLKSAENLKEFIDEQGMTASAFADTLNLEISDVVRYLHAERLPSVKSLVRIADFFNCSTDFLLGLEKEESENRNFLPCPKFSEQLKFLKEHFKCSSYYFYSSTDEHTAISKSRYYDWKNGKRQPSVDNVVRLARRFNCRVDFILGRE